MTSVAEIAPYSTTPLEVVDGIPVFSSRDDYTENCERIATDHPAEMTRTGHNPFIDEMTWQESERETIRLLRQHVQPGQRLLDVGVGLARVVAHSPELDRYGIDISLDYLRHARERGVNVAYARVEEMPYEPRTFELVLATDILEHVPDLKQSMELSDRSVLPFLEEERSWAEGPTADPCYDSVLRAVRSLLGNLLTAYERVPADVPLSEVPMADLEAARDALEEAVSDFDRVSSTMLLATSACN